jgi:hypothetical protein
MPPTLAPMDGFIIFSGDNEYFKIEQATYQYLTNKYPGTELSVGYDSEASIISAADIS